MNVTRLYTRDVIAIPQSTLLKEAARLMSAHHIGCLMVTDDPPLERRAIGIVTDRDLVVYAVARGADPNATSVGHVMTPQIARVSENADARRALEIMAELGIRRLAVTRDSGEIVGVLSYDDLVIGLATEMTDLARINREERNRETVGTRVLANAVEPGS
jgi:CBS domain-containing protein